jgi:hypothetical protein
MLKEKSKQQPLRKTSDAFRTSAGLVHLVAIRNAIHIHHQFP